MNDSLRLLWLTTPSRYSSSDLAERTRALGYNGLAVKESVGGIFWIQPVTTLDEAATSRADGILWQSAWRNAEGGEFIDKTHLEWLQEELEKVEHLLKKGQRLFFYIPGKEGAEWLSDLNLTAKKNTTLLFSAVAGEPTEALKEPHPCWKKEDPTLLPIFNFGMIDQGGGLWPTLPYELYERYLIRLQGKANAGFLTLTSSLPGGKGFLQCSLSLAAEMHQTSRAPELLIEEWFQKHRPELLPFHQEGTLRTLRGLALDLKQPITSLPSETLRAWLEGLAARLNVLELTVTGEKGELTDYVVYFIRDAKRLLQHKAQSAHISFHSTQGIDDLLDGFWTRHSSSKIILLDHPYSGKPGSRMEVIYRENN